MRHIVRLSKRLDFLKQAERDTIPVRLDGSTLATELENREGWKILIGRKHYYNPSSCFFFSWMGNRVIGSPPAS